VKYKACKKCAQSVGTVNVIGNILMIFLKGYMGVVGRSKGLIADAIHSSADLLATIVMIIGLRISDKEPDDDYPHGYGKAEYIVAILIYMFLFVVGIYIIFGGLKAIITGYYVPPCLTAAWGAIFSIAINELMFRQSVCAGHQINSPSMVAKAWESRSDVYSSIAVLIGILGAKMGFYFMDPLAAVIVGVVILKICGEMVKDSVVNLMDKTPEGDVVDDVKKTLSTVEKIRGIKNIIARELGRSIELDLEVFVSKDTSVSEAEKIKNEVKQKIVEMLKRSSVVKVHLLAH